LPCHIDHHLGMYWPYSHMSGLNRSQSAQLCQSLLQHSMLYSIEERSFVYDCTM
jgi:hypothetical protein